MAWSGGTYFLGGPTPGIWPWNRTYAMFAWSDGRLHAFDLTGFTADGTKVDLEPGRWFRYRTAFRSTRAEEVPWTYPSLKGLALFVAARHNEHAPPLRRVVRVSLEDVSWPTPPGKRPAREEVPPGEMLRRTLVDRVEVTQ